MLSPRREKGALGGAQRMKAIRQAMNSHRDCHLQEPSWAPNRLRVWGSHVPAVQATTAPSYAQAAPPSPGAGVESYCEGAGYS